MLTLVILLVLSSKLVSSVTHTVRFNIEVIDGRTSCTSQRVYLMEGDDVYIETEVPSLVNYMWCTDQLGHTPIDRGSYDLNKFYTNANNLSITSLYGPWTCEYLMKHDPSIHTAIERQGSTYNYARCILDINVLETLKYSGLDSSRLTTITGANHTNYFYTYIIGEHLSIGCEYDANTITRIVIEIHDQTGYMIVIKQRFERQATRNLNSTFLSCYYDKDIDRTYKINLYLQARTLMFSGLDPARLRISSNGDQRYSYKPGERLSIGCETDGIEAKTFQFCNTTSRECLNIILSYRKFELQATTELNYWYLLCTIAGNHICLYWDNHERPTTAPATVQTTTIATTSNEWIKNVVIAGACVVIVVLILVIILYRRFRKQENPNEMPENIMSRPPMDLPPEVVYEEVYTHGAGLQRPRRQQARGAVPQHPQ